MIDVRTAVALLDRREKRSALIILFLICLRGFADMVGVAMVFPFLKVLSEPHLIQDNAYLARAYEFGGFRSPDTFVEFIGITLVVLVVATSALKVASIYAVNRWVERRTYSLSTRLLSAYLRQPYEFMLKRHSSELVTNMTYEVQRMVNEVFGTIGELAVSASTLLFMAMLLLFVDPFSTLLVCGFVGGVYVVLLLVTRRLSSVFGATMLAANRERYRIAMEALGGGKQVRLLNRERSLIHEYAGPARLLANTVAKSRLVRQAPRYAVEGITIAGAIILTLVLIARYGGLSGSALNSVIPILGVFLLAGYRMLPAFQSAYSSLVGLGVSKAALTEIHADLLAVTTLPELPKGRIAPLRFSRAIELRNVEYTYPGAATPSLRDINLTIPAGSSVGIVGHTGAGKSTLMDMLLGLLVPTKGEMLIDGCKLDGDSVRAWRANVGYVPQDIFLSDATIAQNIAFGVPSHEIDMARVRTAARMAHIEEFVLSELPDGFETTVGERGVRLSGGQRQRISIARALYTDPEVIAFDEATSALDNKTESLVIGEISRLAGSRTLIMVAHRLTTVRDCQLIVTLEGGTLKSVGTSEDLVVHDQTRRATVDGVR